MNRLEQLRKLQGGLECLPADTFTMYEKLGIFGCQACPHEDMCEQLITAVIAEQKSMAMIESLDELILKTEEI